MCKPHKKWRGNYAKNETVNEQRKAEADADAILEASAGTTYDWEDYDDSCPPFCKGCIAYMYGDDEQVEVVTLDPEEFDAWLETTYSDLALEMELLAPNDTHETFPPPKDGE